MKSADPVMLLFQNDGQRLVKTTFWDSELARAGLCFLTWNAGAGRLLLCDELIPAIPDMREAHCVIVSRGPWPEKHCDDAIELLFEDGSENPYSIQIGSNQCDRMLPSSDGDIDFVVTVWTREGVQLSLPGHYRVVPEIPCLAPWGLE